MLFHKHPRFFLHRGRPHAYVVLPSSNKTTSASVAPTSGDPGSQPLVAPASGFVKAVNFYGGYAQNLYGDTFHQVLDRASTVEGSPLRLVEMMFVDQYMSILGLLILGVLFASGSFVASAMLAPHKKPTKKKSKKTAKKAKKAALKK